MVEVAWLTLPARHRTPPRKGFAVFRLVDRGKMGKWESGAEARKRERTEESPREKERERKRERPIAIGHNVRERKRILISDNTKTVSTSNDRIRGEVG